MISWSNFVPVGNEREYLLDAFSSGWVSGGSFNNNFEKALEKTFRRSKAFTVSNGTSALQLAFQALNVSKGDEVILPAFCFQAGANVAVQLGLTPNFCDVEKDTWNQSLDSIKRAYTENTKGIVVVHNYGVAAPIREICEWAKEKKLWVIEDCAEAWFSKYKGEYVGQYGDIATYSMHATKTIASGEGGVVLVNEESLQERVALIRSHGLDRSQKHYFHILPGNNYRLSNLLSAIAMAQFEKKDLILESQRKVSQLYFELLSEEPLIVCQKGLGNDAVDEIWAVAIYIDFEQLIIDRDRLIQLLEKNEIEVRPGFYSASTLSYHANAIIQSKNADYLSKNMIVLPTSGSVNEEQTRKVCAVLLKIIKDNLKK